MAFMFLWSDEWLDDSDFQPPNHGVPEKDQNPDHSAIIRELLNNGVSADEILLVSCPHCYHTTYYDGGFTSGCEWCGKWAVTPTSEEDEVISLADWWMGQDDPYWGFG